MDLKAKLLANRLPVEPVDVPGVGTVQVRGMSRKEVGAAIDAARDGDGEIDNVRLEVAYLVTAMVEPALTEDEAALWHATGGMDELQPVLDKVMALSGLGKAAAKSDV